MTSLETTGKDIAGLEYPAVTICGQVQTVSPRLHFTSRDMTCLAWKMPWRKDLKNGWWEGRGEGREELRRRRNFSSSSQMTSLASKIQSRPSQPYSRPVRVLLLLHHGYMHYGITDTCIIDGHMDTCIMYTSACVTQPKEHEGRSQEAQSASNLKLGPRGASKFLVYLKDGCNIYFSQTPCFWLICSMLVNP